MPVVELRSHTLAPVAALVVCLALAGTLGCSSQEQRDPAESKGSKLGELVGWLNVDPTSGIVVGWAFDPAAPSSGQPVHFYVDAPGGADHWAGATLTDQYRPDVNEYAGADGDHGFVFEIPDQFRDGFPHLLYGAALGAVDVNEHVWLNGSPASFSFARPGGTRCGD